MIDHKKEEYRENVDKWELIDSVITGDDVEDHLIYLNAHDTSEENRERNKAYRERAVFYPIAEKTALGLVSLMFSEMPILNVPEIMNYVTDTVDGAGTSIFQQSQDLTLDVLTRGRGGLYVTYPDVSAPLSRADMQTGAFFATIHEIEAHQVINWRVSMDGAMLKLSLVVIKEVVTEVVNYKEVFIDQIRELFLQDGVFFERLWRKDEMDVWVPFSESSPRDGKGNPWDVIPFAFVGSSSNAPEIDQSPMIGLIKLNIAHYRNSADYEDSVWFSGQAQPWMSGVTQTHVDLMTKNNMYIGSRSLLGVPSGEKFDFASAPPNPLVRQAMADKLEAMIGLGARYIQPGGVAKTATQSNNDMAVQHSVLSIISGNVSSAYTRALNWVARYMGVAEDTEYRTKQDFVDTNVTAQEIQAMVAGFVQGAIPISDYFTWLQERKIVDNEKTLDEFSSEVSVVF